MQNLILRYFLIVATIIIGGCGKNPASHSPSDQDKSAIREELDALKATLNNDRQQRAATIDNTPYIKMLEELRQTINIIEQEKGLIPNKLLQLEKDIKDLKGRPLLPSPAPSNQEEIQQKLAKMQDELTKTSDQLKQIITPLEKDKQSQPTQSPQNNTEDTLQKALKKVQETQAKLEEAIQKIGTQLSLAEAFQQQAVGNTQSPLQAASVTTQEAAQIKALQLKAQEAIKEIQEKVQQADLYKQDVYNLGESLLAYTENLKATLKQAPKSSAIGPAENKMLQEAMQDIQTALKNQHEVQTSLEGKLQRQIRKILEEAQTSQKQLTQNLEKTKVELETKVKTLKKELASNLATQKKVQDDHEERVQKKLDKLETQLQQVDKLQKSIEASQAQLVLDIQKQIEERNEATKISLHKAVATVQQELKGLFESHKKYTEGIEINYISQQDKITRLESELGKLQEQLGTDKPLAINSEKLASLQKEIEGINNVLATIASVLKDKFAEYDATLGKTLSE